MTCDKCKDIHHAQLYGFTIKSCECDCHVIYFTSGTATATIPFTYTGTNQ